MDESLISGSAGVLPVNASANSAEAVVPKARRWTLLRLTLAVLLALLVLLLSCVAVFALALCMYDYGHSIAYWAFGGIGIVCLALCLVICFGLRYGLMCGTSGSWMGTALFWSAAALTSLSLCVGLTVAGARTAGVSFGQPGSSHHSSWSRHLRDWD